MQVLKNYRHVLAVVFITFLIAFSYIRIYTVTELEGNFDKHVLPGEMFGVPKALVEKGFESLYKLPGQTGWDGQFYYYISNDIFGITDVPKHCDANAYRYQRIGLPLLSNLLAKVTFQDYVSPTMYYFTSLILILGATFFFAKFLTDKGYSPYLSLFWSLGLGTQLTLLNGLPDAAADSLVIMGLLAYYYKRYVLFGITILFAALSREAFIIFPAMIFLFEFFLTLKNKQFQFMIFIKQTLYLTLPIIIFVLWHIYIRVHFHISPSEQAYNILGLPFASFIKYLHFSILFQHPLVPNSSSELISLLYFIFLISISLLMILKQIKNAFSNSKATAYLLPIWVSFATLICLYLSFGDTVMMHHTGYMKASTIFFFMVIFIFTVNNQKVNWKIMVFFIIGLFYFNNEIISRIHPKNIVFHEQMNREVDSLRLPKEAQCLQDFSYQVKIISEKKITDSNPINNIVRKGLGVHERKIVKIFLKNDSINSWPITQGVGGVNMSYHWVAKDGVSVVQDGVRTMLPREIKGGEKIVLDMIVDSPSSENTALILSPVQEGCTWFYTKKLNVEKK